MCCVRAVSVAAVCFGIGGFVCWLVATSVWVLSDMNPVQGDRLAWLGDITTIAGPAFAVVAIAAGLVAPLSSGLVAVFHRVTQIAGHAAQVTDNLTLTTAPNDRLRDWEVGLLGVLLGVLDLVIWVTLGFSIPGQG